MLRKFYALVTALTLLTTISAAQVVEIPDPALRFGIRQALELPQGSPITQQDMKQLTFMSYHDSSLSNLSGIEHAVNLEHLYLSRHNISDISSLSGLTELRSLMINSNPIQDISPIANLVKLTYFAMVDCHISDLSPMSELVDLEEFHAKWGEIEDITPLAKLTNLVRLELHHNQIIDISPLSEMVNLERLTINNNPIVDFSPIAHLSIQDLVRDQICDIPGLSIQARLDGRSMPSVLLSWDDGILNRGGIWWDPSIPYDDRVTPHDLWWHGPGHKFELDFRLMTDGYRLIGNLSEALERREELLAKNPNMIFLADVRQWYSPINRFSEDWFGWRRDEEGNRVLPRYEDGSRVFSTDDHAELKFELPEVQDVIVQRCVAISECGLYDGIMFDAFIVDRSKPEEEWYDLIRRIRDSTPDDFLIMFNTNRWYVPQLAPYINGSFMETFPQEVKHGYTRDRIIEIENNLILWETNAREPQINCLRALGIGSEPPDSPNNRRWMRLFTTMSLTCSDGYSLYTVGQSGNQYHIWHSFWNADLGQPVGGMVQRYEDIEGLYIREFTNGWAVYNRSGAAHIIELPEKVQSVQSGLENNSHAVLDLDGDIFLRILTNPADLNGDGIVNILDLVIVAESLGTGENDVNGDGVTNIFDLVIVAEAMQ